MILLQNVGVLIQMTTVEHRTITFALHCNLHAFLMHSFITEMLGSRVFTITIFNQRSSSARGERREKTDKHFWVVQQYVNISLQLGYIH